MVLWTEQCTGGPGRGMRTTGLPHRLCIVPWVERTDRSSRWWRHRSVWFVRVHKLLCMSSCRAHYCSSPLYKNASLRFGTYYVYTLVNTAAIHSSAARRPGNAGGSRPASHRGSSAAVHTIPINQRARHATAATCSTPAVRLVGAFLTPGTPAAVHSRCQPANF